MSKNIKRSFLFDKESVIRFSEISEDKNKIHLNEEYASKTIFKFPIVHGIFIISKLSAMIAENYINVILISMEYKFLKPIYVGSKVEIHIFSQDTGEKKNSTFKVIDLDSDVCISGQFMTKEKF